MNVFNIKERFHNPSVSMFWFIPPSISLTREWEIRVTTAKHPWESIVSHLTGTTFNLFHVLGPFEIRGVLQLQEDTSYFYSSTSLTELFPCYQFRVLWCFPKSYPFFTQNLAEPTCFLLVSVQGTRFSFSTPFLCFSRNHLALGIYFLKHTQYFLSVFLQNP